MSWYPSFSGDGGGGDKNNNNDKIILNSYLPVFLSNISFLYRYLNENKSLNNINYAISKYCITDTIILNKQEFIDRFSIGKENTAIANTSYNIVFPLYEIINIDNSITNYDNLFRMENAGSDNNKVMHFIRQNYNLNIPEGVTSTNYMFTNRYYFPMNFKINLPNSLLSAKYMFANTYSFNNITKNFNFNQLPINSQFMFYNSQLEHYYYLNFNVNTNHDLNCYGIFQRNQGGYSDSNYTPNYYKSNIKINIIGKNIDLSYFYYTPTLRETDSTKGVMYPYRIGEIDNIFIQGDNVILDNCLRGCIYSSLDPWNNLNASYASNKVIRYSININANKLSWKSFPSIFNYSYAYYNWCTHENPGNAYLINNQYGRSQYIVNNDVIFTDTVNIQTNEIDMSEMFICWDFFNDFLNVYNITDFLHFNYIINNSFYKTFYKSSNIYLDKLNDIYSKINRNNSNQSEMFASSENIRIDNNSYFLYNFLIGDNIDYSYMFANTNFANRYPNYASLNKYNKDIIISGNNLNCSGMFNNSHLNYEIIDMYSKNFCIIGNNIKADNLMTTNIMYNLILQGNNIDLSPANREEKILVFSQTNDIYKNIYINGHNINLSNLFYIRGKYRYNSTNGNWEAGSTPLNYLTLIIDPNSTKIDYSYMFYGAIPYCATNQRNVSSTYLANNFFFSDDCICRNMYNSAYIYNGNLYNKYYDVTGLNFYGNNIKAENMFTNCRFNSIPNIYIQGNNINLQGMFSYVQTGEIRNIYIQGNNINMAYFLQNMNTGQAVISNLYINCEYANINNMFYQIIYSYRSIYNIYIKGNILTQQWNGWLNTRTSVASNINIYCNNTELITKYNLINQLNTQPLQWSTITNGVYNSSYNIRIYNNYNPS